ncbi:hypothetical protein AVEN_234392-1 [Araneus ventricosus]|uniref:Uncharacterized protein n=1 Tax=Araneus ventricosus TaxID=182803 RepID=A0A4Y2A8R8_ARAVE|nr:hypothetical protein AVEN_234392-1 [Araneus ventricosus]
MRADYCWPLKRDNPQQVQQKKIGRESPRAEERLKALKREDNDDEDRPEEKPPSAQVILQALHTLRSSE